MFIVPILKSAYANIILTAYNVTRIHLHDKFSTRTWNDNTILVLKGENKLISRSRWHINAHIKICDVQECLTSSLLPRDYLFFVVYFLGRLSGIMGPVMNWHGTSKLRYDINRWIIHLRRLYSSKAIPPTEELKTAESGIEFYILPLLWRMTYFSDPFFEPFPH